MRLATGGMINKKECDEVSALMIGIGQMSILTALLGNQRLLKKT